jgi:hypothetical protein
MHFDKQPKKAEPEYCLNIREALIIFPPHMFLLMFRMNFKQLEKLLVSLVLTPSKCTPETIAVVTSESAYEPPTNRPIDILDDVSHCLDHLRALVRLLRDKYLERRNQTFGILIPSLSKV